MKLDDFLSNRNLSDLEFASMVQVDRSTISRLRRGKIGPSLELLSRIVAATDNSVTLNDFVESADATRSSENEVAA